MLSATRFFRLATIAVALSSVVSGTAAGGSIRYELTELLGEHVYDGSSWTSVVQWIQTPFGYTWPGIDESRIVIEGRVTTGQAHGNGVFLENKSFHVLPLVSAGGATFNHTIALTPITAFTPETFRIEVINTDPFRHETPPLPNPSGNPPLSFQVALSVGAAPANLFHEPRRLDPILLTPNGDLGNAYVYDVPIVATIETAYVILTGPGVTVPEPSGVVVAAGLLLIAVGQFGFRRRSEKPKTSVVG